MNKPLIVFFILACTAISCGTTKKVFGGHLKNMSTAELNGKIKENTIQFNTFSGKAKIDVHGSNIEQSVNASIDIRKDSVIGISLRLMGVEGARVQITPDSIKILDRLNQEYIPRDFSFLDSAFSLNITFSDLQNLLLGNTVFYDSTSLSPGISEDKYVLITQKGVYKNTLWLTSGFDIMRMFIEDLNTRKTLTLSFDDYRKIEGRSFSFIRTILIDAKDDLTANVEYSKAVFDEPFEFTFSINPKYKRVD